MRLPLFRLYLAVLTALTLAAGLDWARPLLHPLHEPGLPPVASSLAHTPAAAQRVRVLGYERERFGGWSPREGCTTREHVIAAQLEQPAPACDLPRHAVGTDPYTGGTFTVGGTEVDHIFPLSAAWDAGAHAWSDARRHSFANDPANLVAVDGGVNQEKSDLMPSQWSPSDRSARCWYARRLAGVAASYQLSLSEEDRRALRRMCLWR
ncbi:HNH endonuclease family protein [Corynebacterium guangdongense]|uniref:GmrSD restriction endonucleases C-terminal domain-containing protein n=1 Tax=Corynebacterium guangdongense TaxID=1783348 RepID=A0ABU1ZXI0_9CORY|nr:HNH endonuclease family protein [Corynebacterium guangdongense]MDR7329068.1 hypothetical protein [Corynebacterium guangdongense]